MTRATTCEFCSASIARALPSRANLRCPEFKNQCTTDEQRTCVKAGGKGLLIIQTWPSWPHQARHWFSCLQRSKRPQQLQVDHATCPS